MIVALLAVIVILLLPGGAPFIARLCTGILILIGLLCAHVLWGSVAFWVIGGVAVIVTGAFVYALIVELARPRRRYLSGGR